MADPSPSRLMFCFGLGYSGRALAEALAADGWRVAGTARRAETVARLAADGLAAVRFADDAGAPDTGAPDTGAPDLPAETTHLLSTVAPDRDGADDGVALDPVLRVCHDRIAALPKLDWVGYLSTTGVYGDHGGAEVDETTPPTPSGPRQRARLIAEDAWLDLHRRHGVPVHIFRLAGIYGPGRSALDSLRAGTARRIDKPGQMFGRIHRDDIVRVLRASIARPAPGTVYNVADDEPAPSHQVIAYAAELLGVAPPPLEPFDPRTLSPMAISFYSDNRRVLNDRIKRELGVTLAHPTYREGLAAELARGRPT